MSTQIRVVGERRLISFREVDPSDKWAEFSYECDPRSGMVLAPSMQVTVRIDYSLEEAFEGLFLRQSYCAVERAILEEARRGMFMLVDLWELQYEVYGWAPPGDIWAQGRFRDVWIRAEIESGTDIGKVLARRAGQ